MKGFWRGTGRNTARLWSGVGGWAKRVRSGLFRGAKQAGVT
jgi:hypothetical protein